jgi:hypothetical protein
VALQVLDLEIDRCPFAEDAVLVQRDLAPLPALEIERDARSRHPEPAGEATASSEVGDLDASRCVGEKEPVAQLLDDFRGVTAMASGERRRQLPEVLHVEYAHRRLVTPRAREDERKFPRALEGRGQALRALVEERRESLVIDREIRPRSARRSNELSCPRSGGSHHTVA